jgi:Tol biopolymer transport system component
VRVRGSGTTERITNGNGPSRDAAISGNGRYVAFESTANNLVPGDDNGVSDVFVYDRTSDTTTIVSRSSGGEAGNVASNDPNLSSDGTFVVYSSSASNLVSGDTNGQKDIFLTNVRTGNTRRVNVRANGRQATGGSSHNASISANGRVIVFDSNATNLVKRDTNRQEDVFVRDLAKGTTTRVSVRSGGGQVLGGGYDPTVSGNGRWVAFSSAASNLVRGDTNGRIDAFVHDRTTKSTRRVSVRSSGRQARSGVSDDVAISRDGRYVVFESTSRDMVAGDTNRREDVFRRGKIR